MRLVVATTNPGKLKEIIHLLDGLPIEVLSFADYPSIPEAEETRLYVRRKRSFESRSTLLASLVRWSLPMTADWKSMLSEAVRELTPVVLPAWAVPYRCPAKWEASPGNGGCC